MIAAMLVWTIHPYPLWEHLQHDGILYGPGPYCLDEDRQWRIISLYGCMNKYSCNICFFRVR